MDLVLLIRQRFLFVLYLYIKKLHAVVFFSRTRRRAAHQYIKKKRGKIPRNRQNNTQKHTYTHKHTHTHRTHLARKNNWSRGRDRAFVS
jgi:hypothetical protein